MVADETAARGLVPACMVETAEGAVSMAQTPKKGFAVLTRLDSGTLGFRQLLHLEERPDAALVRLVLDNGHAVVAARGHLFFRPGLVAVPAGELEPGDALETAYRYPDGYLPAGQAEAPGAWGIRVARVESAGTGTVMFGSVRDTHRMFLTAGVLCGE